MKVAIFGDSYGDDRFKGINERSWVSFLEDAFDIDNYSFTGSGIYYSYDLFLKHHSDYEKIIFLVTAPDRITLPSDSKLQVFCHVNYTQAKVWASLTEGQQQKDYQLIVDYYENIHNQRLNETYHRLMVNNIATMRPDAIVYPCFDFEYLPKYPLYNVTKFEDGYLGMDDNKRVEFYKNKLRDSRACHMTENNNRVVSEMFMNLLYRNNYVLDDSKLVIPDKQIDYYYQSAFIEPYTYSKKF